MGNDPLNFMDPSGEESLVVSGNDTESKLKGHFTENASARAMEMQNSDANTTWVVMDVGGAEYRASVNQHAATATAAGVNVVRVTSADQMSNYMKTKSIDGNTDTRGADKITNYAYVGHGNGINGGGRPALLVHQNAATSFDGILTSGQFGVGSFSQNATINISATCNSDFMAGVISTSIPGATVSGRVGNSDFFTQGVDSDFALGDPSRVPSWSTYNHASSTVTTYINGERQ